MPAKKKLRTEIEPPSQEVVAWIKANDKLIGNTPVTISSLFDSCSIKSFTERQFDANAKRLMPTGKMVDADWTSFRAALESRTPDSPLWFIQRRIEDLLLAPDGLIGERVESFVIVESPFATLAPRHYILAEPLPDADPEDHVPSRVLELEEQDVKWNPITKNDGTSINAYIMQRKSAVPAFSFGAAAPPTATAAPTVAGFGSAAPTAAPTGFSFGAAPAPSAPATGGFAFSFGAPSAASTASVVPAPQPPAATGFGFGFGATPSAPAAAPAAAATTAASLPAVKRVPVEDILFTIWDEERAKEMKKLSASGSRIVIEDFKIPTTGKTVKLVMQDDVKEKPEDAASEFILKKLFARQNERVSAFDKWMDDCPELEPHLLEFLQKTREKMLKSESKSEEAEEGETTFKQLFSQVSPAIISALAAAVDRRKPIRESQTAIMDNIVTLLKEKKMASKDRCRILKFYPANDKTPFRPFGKVSGISEEGEEAICDPPAYRFINPFTGKSS